MSILPNKCECTQLLHVKRNSNRIGLLICYRFIDCEKWRSEYAGKGVEELVRTFEYTERPEVFKYYPQYYHKTDKVCRQSVGEYICAFPSRTRK
jgi:hypothetical protein